MPTFLARPSLALRIALLVGLLYVLQNGLFDGLMAYVTSRSTDAVLESTLDGEVSSLAHAFDALALQQPPADTVTAAAAPAAGVDWKRAEQLAHLAAERQHQLGFETYRFRVLDAEGQLRADTGGDGAQLPAEASQNGTLTQGGVRYASARSHATLATIVGSVDEHDALRPSQEIGRISLLGSILTLLVGVLGAAFVGRQVAKPVRALRDAAQQIARTGELATRIDVERTDEIGELASAFRDMTGRMQTIIQTLHGSAQRLTRASSELSASTTQQQETLSRHAAALQETQATAQEIRQTSVLAAQKAESILQVADKGDLLGREGEGALEQSVQSLSAIRAQVEDIARQIGALSQRAQQIESITQTVKDLANQSNMLALNAAIEASRSGEHGKGFAVVAREIRSLADQSIVATRQVRQILEDVTGRISQAAEVTEQGARRMEAGLEQIRTSGDKLKELSNMVRDSSSAARQIAAAVSQQSAGISEIFAAVTEQNRMMEETLERISSTTEAVQVVDQVSSDVVRIVEGHRAA